ncbi:hypothetical protein L0222_23440 [bacterium]|nr:hypothetical protein [bacterium]
MKTVVFILTLLLVSTFAQAVSVEQIGKLSELKTKDDLILELVQREGLDRPLTAEDVIFLREKGANERVIEYLLNLSPRASSVVPKQEGESVWIEKNLRAYRTRDKRGKPIVVVTNLDENGKRMGPPPPPTPEETHVAPEELRPVQEVLVTVRHQEPQPYEEEYVEEPEYVNSGIPLYPSYYPSYYPYVNQNPYPGKLHCATPANRPAGSFQTVRNNPPARNSQPRVQGKVQRPASAGMAPRTRR